MMARIAPRSRQLRRRALAARQHRAARRVAHRSQLLWLLQRAMPQQGWEPVVRAATRRRPPSSAPPPGARPGPALQADADAGNRRAAPVSASAPAAVAAAPADDGGSDASARASAREAPPPRRPAAARAVLRQHRRCRPRTRGSPGRRRCSRTWSRSSRSASRCSRRRPPNIRSGWRGATSSSKKAQDNLVRHLRAHAARRRRRCSSRPWTRRRPRPCSQARSAHRQRHPQRDGAGAGRAPDGHHQRCCARSRRPEPRKRMPEDKKS